MLGDAGAADLNVALDGVWRVAETGFLQIPVAALVSRASARLPLATRHSPLGIR
jgi:hypothetical protein